MNLDEVIDRVSKETGLPSKVVLKVFKAYWYFIRNSIQALPLKETLSEEEFSKLRTNFNIPSLGKLSCIYENYLRKKRAHEYIKEFRKKHVISYKENKASF